MRKEKPCFQDKRKRIKAASKRKSGFYRKGESIPECIKKGQGKIRMFLNVRELGSNEISEVNVPRKRFKHDTDTLPKGQQKDFKTIQESIKQFHSNIAIGPLNVCSYCHQTWFRKTSRK